jgi:hypothetical protein
VDGDFDHLASVSELEGRNSKLKVKAKFAFTATQEDEASWHSFSGKQKQTLTANVSLHSCFAFFVFIDDR